MRPVKTIYFIIVIEWIHLHVQLDLERHVYNPQIPQRLWDAVQKCLAEVKQSSDVLDTVCDLVGSVGGNYGGTAG